VINWYGLWGV